MFDPHETKHDDKEDLNRCFACHKSNAQQDFVWMFDRMKNAK